jgi:hypothetical protein
MSVNAKNTIHETGRNVKMLIFFSVCENAGEAG